MGNQGIQYRRIDPTFQLETPLLFAHRGGVLEAPESTVKGFRHALEIAEAEVLELDVQLTMDGEFVVWHGPDLDNVRIEGENDRPSKRPKNRRKICHFRWEDLDRKAWVADPEVKKHKAEEINLADVPPSEDRNLLLLSDLLKKFPDIPLNIEMKSSFKRKINEDNRRGLRDNIREFSDILNRDPGERKIVVVSAHDDFIDAFRQINGERFSTGLSMQEQLVLQFINLDLKNRVLETSYNKHLSGKGLIERVRQLGGSTFVFLTGFGPFLPSIDDEPKKEEIFEILNRGVDGIMTDRPRRLREFMEAWKSSL